MNDELRSVRDVWRKLPSEADARQFLEELIWPSGRNCPHCGSLRSTELQGDAHRAGLYQCRERECRRQFTVTTKTPMHATKLELRLWIAAMFLVLTSSKGISSVVMARILGVSQPTAWKMGHAIRTLMEDREGLFSKLGGVVEVDEAYVGGAPKFKKGVRHRPGRGTRKPMVLVAASRGGQARAAIVSNGRGKTFAPLMNAWIEPSAILMTDGNRAYNKPAQAFTAHLKVNHGKKQFAIPGTGVHINTVEAVTSQVQRALVGVYHRLDRPHLQRYLDEVLWRWNHRIHSSKVRQRRSRSGAVSCRATKVWKRIPVLSQMRGLLCCAVGRQVKRTPEWGLMWVPSDESAALA